MVADDRRASTGGRVGVLRVLKSAREPMSINDIAAELGVHPNTVRFHLESLVAAGQVERVDPDRRGAGRPPLLFRPVRGMDPTGPRHYRLLAEVLADDLAAHPDAGSRAVGAGRAWGRRLGGSTGARGAALGTPGTDGRGGRSAARKQAASAAGVAALVSLLDEIGFAPEERKHKGAIAIGLRHCPFLELAQTRRDIICPVHLGLMQGAMEAWQSPLTVTRLDPFVEPDLCMAHLTAAGSS